MLIPLEHSTAKWKGDENEYFLGYEMNWAAFHIVEIMASTKLRYLIFHDDTNSLLKRPKMQHLLSPKVPLSQVSISLHGSFNMSQTRYFSEKRLGYWAASQCFDEGTDVLMLTTNLIKKDILKGSEWESGLALGGLACFMTPDLGLFR